MQSGTATLLEHHEIVEVTDIRLSISGLEYTIGRCTGYAWSEPGERQCHLELVFLDSESHDLATYLQHQGVGHGRLLASFSVNGSWIYGPGTLEFGRGGKAAITIRNCLSPLAQAS